MFTDTKDKLLAYLREHRQATAKELQEYLEISRQGLFKQLNNLLRQGLIYKIGSAPKVFYLLADNKLPSANSAAWKNLSPEEYALLEKEFSWVSPTGLVLKGLAGFEYFCTKNKLELTKAAADYAKIWQKYHAYQQDELLDGLPKMKSTFKKIYLDKVFYLDFYSLERFGKTKLGQLLLYAKQSQSRPMIKEVVELIKPRLRKLILQEKIEAIGFVPPSVKREVQFMKELEKYLHLEIPTIKLTKVKTAVVVPQKTLSKLEDRVENASKTIIVEEQKKYNNILLIDDAVGSGATLNEIARSIQERGICQGQLIGLALVGSYKGFDIINEV